MNDKNLENLVRMAVEIDELERFETPVASDAPTISLASSGRIRRLAYAGLATAAAVAALLLMRPAQQTEALPNVPGMPFEISYCPGTAEEDGIRIDHFEPSTAKDCVVPVSYTHLTLPTN